MYVFIPDFAVFFPFIGHFDAITSENWGTNIHNRRFVLSTSKILDYGGEAYPLIRK